MIGKLYYVVYNRQDITLVVGIVAIFSFDPKETYMTMKRIIKYLRETKDYGPWYKQEDEFKLKVYMDINWDGNDDDKKRTIGGYLYLGERYG